MNDWIGYAVASIYYLGLDLGYADAMCGLSKYGFNIINFLYRTLSYLETN